MTICLNLYGIIFPCLKSNLLWRLREPTAESKEGYMYDYEV